MSLGGFDPPPLILMLSVRFQYATMTRFDICPPLSFARLFLRIYPSQPSLCPSSYIYHWVVSINRPSGYEPDALPLRHNDGLSLDGFDPSPLGSLVCDHTLQTGGFDPPPLIPPVCVHYTSMTRFDICPLLSFARLFLRIYPSQTSLCPSSYISSGCFDQPSYEPDAL